MNLKKSKMEGREETQEFFRCITRRFFVVVYFIRTLNIENPTLAASPKSGYFYRLCCIMDKL